MTWVYVALIAWGVSSIQLAALFFFVRKAILRQLGPMLAPMAGLVAKPKPSTPVGENARP